MIVVCKYCSNKIEKSNGAVNRANKVGLNIFCNRTCVGLYRRKNKTEAEKKEHKRLYDIGYRDKNNSKLKAKKAAYNKSESGRATQKRSRDKQKQYHLEYCQTEEYKKWKKDYDKKHRAKKCYGEFWESSILLMEIERQIPNFEVKQQLQLINKSQKRRRDYEKSKC